ncbi:MAG: hypothetical protein ACTSQE_15815 [Candidatus Heimdallarchaeaceae archaeon]
MLSEKGIVEKLIHPSTYDHEVSSEIKCIETNVHWVFLTGNYVYKMKKTVKFGDVLDFSTLDLRHKACMSEIELNKRLAPDLYIGVVKFTSDGKINGTGETIEYLIKMRELSQDLLLSNIVQKEYKIDQEIIVQIVKKIADFHKKNIYQGYVNAFEDIFEKWDENFRTTSNYEGFPFDKKFADRVYSFLRKNKSFWDTRLEQNKIVDGHGDLQLRNIFIENNQVIIFDCIEFNETLRIQDILEEIAFLSMDLDFHGLKKDSKFLLQEYLKAMNENYKEVKDKIVFYKSYRAYVRAKVHYSTYLYGKIEEEKHFHYKQALKYLKLAESYVF